MASRTWLAISLCAGVWLVWLQWFAPKNDLPETTPTEQVSGAAPTAVPATHNGVFGAGLKTKADFPISNGKLNISFSSQGGKIEEITVPEYRETTKKDSPPIAVVSTAISSYALSTLFTEPSLATLSDGAYKAQVDKLSAHFEQKTAQGVEITKDYRFSENSYLSEAKISIRFPVTQRGDWGEMMIPVGAKTPQYDSNLPLKHWEVVAYQNDSVTRKTTDSLKSEQEVLQGNTAWLAFGNRYFSTAVMNESKINPDIVLLSDANFSGGYLRFPLKLKDGQNQLDFSFKIYSGPKDYSHLSKVAGLKPLIDYGRLSFLAFPLLELLRFFYKFIHNYGLAIILLTVVVRMLFYPLSLKSYKSMKSMQKLQPQIQALKEQYADNKEKFNREQIALFKTHKVNPAGGCLPMLVQLPVFIALYSVLGNSIELFHAPFFGWLQDLSSKDPYYIFPVLMGVVMVVQQKLTPAVGMDPAQQKAMMIMPVVFTFFMINLPSGLTVYMFVSTLLGILQQVSMNRNPKGAALTVAGTVK